MSYGPGIAVAAPLPLSKKQSSKCKEQKDNEQKCTCGSSDHKRTTHRDCPLNKKNTTSTTQDRLVPQMSQQVCQVAIAANGEGCTSSSTSTTNCTIAEHCD